MACTLPITGTAIPGPEFWILMKNENQEYRRRQQTIRNQSLWRTRTSIWSTLNPDIKFSHEILNWRQVWRETSKHINFYNTQYQILVSTSSCNHYSCHHLQDSSSPHLRHQYSRTCLANVFQVRTPIRRYLLNTYSSLTMAWLQAKTIYLAMRSKSSWFTCVLILGVIQKLRKTILVFYSLPLCSTFLPFSVNTSPTASPKLHYVIYRQPFM